MSVDVGQKTALDLWLEWWEGNGNPWVGDATDYGKPDSCFFCGEYREDTIWGKGGHDSDCLYLRIAKLLEKEPVK